jgi:hypothetical protein
MEVSKIKKELHIMEALIQIKYPLKIKAAPACKIKL